MKIVFIGTVEFSHKALEKIIDLNYDVVGVCTKQKSGFNSDFKDLSPICENNNIDYKYVKDINASDNIQWIKNLNPDIIFCFGWSSLIKKKLLNIAPMGVVGFHPAELPYNRGRHPLIWALALGLKRSASTFFFMKEGADDGDILSQEIFEITLKDDAKSLYSKVIKIALTQIETFLPKLEMKTFTRMKQDDTKANYWRKRGQKDGLIDFRMSSSSIYNLVRALSKPYVGAHLEYKDTNISIWKSEVVDFNEKNIESGKVLKIEGQHIIIKTYDGAIKLLEHEFIILPSVGEYL